MAIAFVASQEGVSGTNAASYSIAPLPTGTTAGNVCFVIIACPTSTTGSCTFSGWTLVREFLNGSAHRASVWYRVVQGGDADATSFTFDQPGTAEGIAWVSSEYSGVNTTYPLITETGAFSANDADFSLGTGSTDNTDPTAWQVVAGALSDLEANDTTTALAVSGMTERNDIDGSATSEVTAAAWYDSNGVVTAGSKSATVTQTSGTVAMDMAAWIGILNPTKPVQAGSSLLIQKQAVNRAAFW